MPPSEPREDPAHIVQAQDLDTSLTEAATQHRASTGSDSHGSPGNSPETRVTFISGGPRFGAYELLVEIARGGMGVVYQARHVQLGRLVALKTILAGQLASHEQVQRFHTEARAAATLEHPSIVPVYDIGETDGQHFFAMKFIPGQSLKTRLSVGPLEPRDAAELMAQIADAVGYAHDHGIVHRDLKPANVLLDLDGHPHVSDFGLAKNVDADSQLTGSGEILGTPSYMPPEQAQGRLDLVGASADIYSLGATLYCMLTGRPPFQAATLVETLKQVLEHDPVSPRQLNPAISEDLELICLKCLEKKPEDRYHTAAQLGADLRRFLDGQPISVRSLSVLGRFARTLQRNRDDVALRGWSRIIFAIAPIVLISQIALCIHAWNGPPYHLGVGVLIRGGELIALGLVLWHQRGTWMTSLDSAGRQMLSFCFGYLIARIAVVAVMLETHALRQPQQPFELLDVYPVLSILSGFLLFVMGSNYWGMFYLMGAVFLGLAMINPLWPRWAPLEFGLWWFVCLHLIGRRLAGLSKRG